MGLRWCGSVALFAIIGIAALFLFPVAHGSYSATHGPTTTLRWKQLRAVLMFVISAAVFLVAQLLAPVTFLTAIVNADESSGMSPALATCSPLRR